MYINILLQTPEPQKMDGQSNKRDVRTLKIQYFAKILVSMTNEIRGTKMEYSLLQWLTGSALISIGLMTGVYFTFSAFVMAALKTQPNHQGANTMISINRVILTSTFMPLFFGSSLLSLTLLIMGDVLAQLAAAVYLLGMFVVTAVFNVPLNNQLRDATAQQLSTIWGQYLRQWTIWNHIRAVSSLTAATLFLLSLGGS